MTKNEGQNDALTSQKEAYQDTSGKFKEGNPGRPKKKKVAKSVKDRIDEQIMKMPSTQMKRLMDKNAHSIIQLRSTLSKEGEVEEGITQEQLEQILEAINTENPLSPSDFLAKLNRLIQEMVLSNVPPSHIAQMVQYANLYAKLNDEAISSSHDRSINIISSIPRNFSENISSEEEHEDIPINDLRPTEEADRRDILAAHASSESSTQYPPSPAAQNDDIL